MHANVEQFTSLCDMMEDPNAERMVTGEDLEGYWETVNLEVHDRNRAHITHGSQIVSIVRRFEALATQQENNWQVEPEAPAPPKKRKKGGNNGRGGKRRKRYIALHRLRLTQARSAKTSPSKDAERKAKFAEVKRRMKAKRLEQQVDCGAHESTLTKLLVERDWVTWCLHRSWPEVRSQQQLFLPPGEYHSLGPCIRQQA